FSEQADSDVFRPRMLRLVDAPLRRSMQAANERAMIPPAAQAPDLRARRAPLSVPIANAVRLVLPDKLGRSFKITEAGLPQVCSLAGCRPGNGQQSCAGDIHGIYKACRQDMLRGPRRPA